MSLLTQAWKFLFWGNKQSLLWYAVVEIFTCVNDSVTWVTVNKTSIIFAFCFINIFFHYFPNITIRPDVLSLRAVSARNLSFLVYWSSWVWFRNYYAQGKIMQKRVTSLSFTFCWKTCHDTNNCFCKIIKLLTLSNFIFLSVLCSFTQFLSVFFVLPRKELVLLTLMHKYMTYASDKLLKNKTLADLLCKVNFLILLIP